MRLNDRKLANWLISIVALLVPLVLALLLWAILNALTDGLRRWRFPAWVASGSVSP
jgi:hypothetical protein